MDVVRQQVTADELLNMPDDGFRYELVQGGLRRMNPAGNVHGRVAMSFAWRLAQYVDENRLSTVYAAETGFRRATDPDTVRAGRGLREPGPPRSSRRGRGVLARSAGSSNRGGFTR
jgi:Uma2 family endonuclease